MIEVKVEGLEQVERRLAEMGPALGSATMGLALKIAAEPTVDMAKALCPFQENKKGKYRRRHLRNSINASTRVRRQEAQYVQGGAIAYAFIGPGGKGSAAGHLVEFGHRLVVNRGKNNGRFILTVPPHPFLRPAWDATQMTVLERFTEQVGSVIEAVAAGASAADIVTALKTAGIAK